MELFDLYDKEGNLLGKTMERGSSNQEGEYHLVVHIWIQNSKGEFLIQQRNKDTDRIPHQWAATGGAVSSGETSIEGAIRETYEELGIKVKGEDFQFMGRFYSHTKKTNYMTDLYLIQKDFLIEDMILDIKEVRQVSYMTLDDYKRLVSENKAWEYEDMPSRNGYYKALEKS
jgi:8-oxo-dGTP pyrophosphatase MutT (NUDIX family)